MTHDDLVDELNDLVETCKDGEYGFKACADHVQAELLKSLVLQRAGECARAAVELQNLVAQYGGKPDTGGTVGGAVHRGWIAARSALPGDSDLAMLEECERGEDRAIAAYRKALKNPMPTEVLALLERQARGAKLNHDALRDVRDRLRATNTTA
ncbi:MAG: PA2169 family four-helix-bundle protein [Burkholderiales bacterium]